MLRAFCGMGILLPARSVFNACKIGTPVATLLHWWVYWNIASSNSVHPRKASAMFLVPHLAGTGNKTPVRLRTCCGSTFPASASPLQGVRHGGSNTRTSLTDKECQYL